MRRIRGGSGLGDSVYLRPIVDRLIRNGDRVTVMSYFPDVFIDSGAHVEPFNRVSINVLAHYAGDRANQKSTQFADMLRSAQMSEDIPLRFEWTVRNPGLVDRVRTSAGGRPIIVVHGGRPPFGRSDGLGAEILPQRTAFIAALGGLVDDCFTVRIGKGPKTYDLPSHLDLYDQTSVSDLLDLIKIADGVVTQCGYPIPMAECFDTPLLAVWSDRGLASANPVIASVTPAKILSKDSSKFVMDAWAPAHIAEATRDALVEKIAA